MAQIQDWIPAGIDTNVPSMARVYDYILGGAHNFAADRQVGSQIEKLVPGLPNVARLNRRFLGRAVNFMADQGVRQFLDIGSGIPTVMNVHEVAQQRDPAARIVYVDKDPVAVAHSRLMLSDNENAAIVQADMRDPEAVLSSPEVARLLRFDESVGLLMLLMLHWVPDEDSPEKLVAHYRDALPAGSFVAMTHVAKDQIDEKVDEAAAVVNRSKSADQMHMRTHEQVSALFEGFDLVEPGLVGCGEWRPDGPGDVADETLENMFLYAGVGRKG
ncbi:S-adenosyl methyltransferase [Lentzea xinjiangensis]|uniref:S-adenosyl methyltransferase n=1 Tax=Lentzea xinjiangensis TaxID=402600 RepID=A0A1H9DDI9_9PSEU|nr:SAM-dependent methyltransferase [Lentzea xinjiangensis]SEQ11377.1 S-adenosyl methyltransferase [Lentzea xinjiangensis]